MPFVAPYFKRHIHIKRASPYLIAPSSSGVHVVFQYGRERGLMLEDVDETQLLLLSLLDGQHSFTDIVSLLQKHEPTVNAEEVAENLEELAQLGLIEDAAISPPEDWTATDRERYESQLRFISMLDTTGMRKYELQTMLKRARITVLGLGGLGSNVLKGLAAIGIGFIRGVDSDVVELGNLNRQLYDVGDIGQSKALAAADQVQRFNPELCFEPVQCCIDGPESIVELIKDTDLVAMCADTPADLYSWMTRASLDTGIPHISGGYHGSVAEIDPFFVPLKTGCERCAAGEPYEEEIKELAWIHESYWLRHPNIHFVTAAAASLMCSEIFKHITKLIEPATYNHIYSLDIEHFTLTDMPWFRSENCQVCGSASRSAVAVSTTNDSGE